MTITRQRLALFALLLGTALLYLWDLGSSGYANTYYSAAVQAATQSWKAWLFGSLDAGNVVTVDKPPAALWLMGLSARLFGFSSWSMLVPQALAGVASVALLHATVRRWFGSGAGLLAGAVLALTPVAAIMFRFNNPDALLVLLLVAAGYCLTRALENGSTRWLLLCGTAIGFGFLTKMLQAFLVLPAFGLVYLIAAPTGLGRRVAQLFGALGAVIVSAGWYIALVELWPAADRPYIGGSTTNSALELALGYNGLSRIFGGGGPSGGGGGGERVMTGGGGSGNLGFGGEAGITRLFGDSMGAEISWLLPAALIGLVAGLWFTRRAPRTDRTRAALILWGGWLVVSGLVFSFMSGIVHPYYTVALAPAIGALVAISGRQLWLGRKNTSARAVLALMIVSTGVWGAILLSRNGSWYTYLGWAAFGLSVVAATGVLVGVHRLSALLLAITLIGGVSSTAAYAAVTASVPHTGSIPMSGPRKQEGREPETNAKLVELLKATTTKWAAASGGAQGAGGLQLASGRPVIAIGGFSGRDPAPTLEEFKSFVAQGQIGYYISGGMGMGPGGSSEIATWVQENFAPVSHGDHTVYKLT
ncbi:glycosyltransferase family 39 protein [Allokutzneria sp. A3M-2-11 16]|uniref:glycosyltransferase family 39 protein n=1 Tax=Allokutzneria sp. A3M-2-11 16 TaxID=2962043 RepID=UPI0020B8FCE1|nr:glycosyltransferase family 39 protein [Allokutzneria sp. A3M-2-11 16]MCP3805502.1 glycosyltransferase family 39 protein [Allokutzneria sp. A3M-2-11 16]